MILFYRSLAVLSMQWKNRRSRDSFAALCNFKRRSAPLPLRSAPRGYPNSPPGLFGLRPSNLFKSQTKNHPMGWFLFGGEGEIRTLERFYPLHDFQSCALDQLSDFSVSLTSRSIALDYYITAIPQCQHKNLIVLRNNFAFWGNYF